MKQKKYLHLIVETYLEIQDALFHYEHSNGLQDSDIMINLKKKMFQEKILRYQKIARKKHSVSENEFENGCLIAIDFLKERTYLNAFIEKNRLNDYRTEIKGSEELNGDEIKVLKEKITKEIEEFDIEDYLSPLSNFEKSLKGKISNNDSQIIELFFEGIDFENDKKTNEPESIDLSDTSTTEKIIYLKKLGVLDFLKDKQPFLSSTNKLATVLSAITGARSTTIQSMINPIFSKNIDDKNNPLNSEKTVKKVENRLTDIDYNIK
ncbi:MAG TPA: hypothetical protein VF465_00830 [Flavobacterium sp.]|uniref:hypothetical protein n=1 Tax=Flavobacterium sp. TaxID=239 RepID=UPI002ED4E8A9